jgi:hypothetical protein
MYREDAGEIVNLNGIDVKLELSKIRW